MARQLAHNRLQAITFLIMLTLILHTSASIDEFYRLLSNKIAKCSCQLELCINFAFSWLINWHGPGIVTLFTSSFPTYSTCQLNFCECGFTTLSSCHILCIFDIFHSQNIHELNIQISGLFDEKTRTIHLHNHTSTLHIPNRHVTICTLFRFDHRLHSTAKYSNFLVLLKHFLVFFFSCGHI